MYGLVPPLGLTVAVPLAPPKQLTFVDEMFAALITVGSVIVILFVAVQLLASVTVTV